MKKYILLLIAAMTLTAAQAQSFTYLNFVDANAAVTQLATDGLKITFAEGNALITVGEETTTLPLSSLDYMEFTNTEYSGNEFAPGDVDGNGIIDVEDVNAAINLILKINQVTDYPGSADIDGNGIIDVEDVNNIINIILKIN